MKNIRSKEELLKYYMGLPYSIKIIPDESGGFFVKIEELPGCMSQGETIEEVIENIKDAQKSWLEVAIEENIDIPLPEIVEEYSGKFVIRILKSLHKKLSNQAKKEGISLNQLIVSILSERYSLREIQKQIKSFDWIINQLIIHPQIQMYESELQIPTSIDAKKVYISLVSEVDKVEKRKEFNYKRVL